MSSNSPSSVSRSRWALIASTFPSDVMVIANHKLKRKLGYEMVLLRIQRGVALRILFRFGFGHSTSWSFLIGLFVSLCSVFFLIL